MVQHEKYGQIVEMPIGEIIPYPNNPRVNDDAVDKVANSIREFGFRSPIVVDKDMVIIAGHTRLKASQMLGLKTVPVLIADNLTPEQVKAYRLADNKTAELSEWDTGLLDEELFAIEDIDMSQFGFDPIVTIDGFDEDFTLPDGDKDDNVVMSFTMTTAQSEMVKDAMDCITDEMSEDSVNRNGWRISEVCRRWLAQKR